MRVFCGSTLFGSEVAISGSTAFGTFTLASFFSPRGWHIATTDYLVILVTQQSHSVTNMKHWEPAFSIHTFYNHTVPVQHLCLHLVRKVMALASCKCRCMLMRSIFNLGT